MIDYIGIVAKNIKERSSTTSIREFSPEEHKSIRWQAIASTVYLATSEDRERFEACTNGRHAFKELLLAYPHHYWLQIAPLTSNDASLDIENIIELYESLMHEDFALSDSGTEVISRSVNRKHSGAFYTPRDLAVECVRVASEAYIESKLEVPSFLQSQTLSLRDKQSIIYALSTARILDPSCGVGRFLVAYANFVSQLAYRWFGSVEKVIYHRLLNNLFGFDIDPIALGLCRLSILNTLVDHTYSYGEDVGSLCNNIALANLLIGKGRNEPSMINGIHALSAGYIYSPDIGRPDELLSQNFDIVIGNPPWEKIRLEERDFLSHLHTDLQYGTTKTERDNEIRKLESHSPAVFSYLLHMRESIKKARDSISRDPWLKHSTHGELNTCSLFIEIGTHLMNRHSSACAILVKTSTLTHFANRRLFAFLVKEKLISKVFDFINSKRIFPIDSRERFALLVLSPRSQTIELAMGLSSPTDINDLSKRVDLSHDDLYLLNPDTGMLPIPGDTKDLELLKKIYRLNSAFSEVYPTTKFGRIVHLTMHSKEISKIHHNDWLPIQEGKFIERYDGRFSTFKNVPEDKRFTARASAIRISDQQKCDPNTAPEARYFISPDTWHRLSKNYNDEWSIYWRSTTSASNSRTCIATILPHCPAIQSLQMAQFPGLSTQHIAIVLAIMNSAVFDFVIRNKLSGIDLTQAVIGQAAVPVLDRWEKSETFDGVTAALHIHVSARVKALLCGDIRLEKFTESLKGDLPSPKTRQSLLSDIDHLVMLAYGLSGSDMSYIYNRLQPKEKKEACRGKTGAHRTTLANCLPELNAAG